ncbi:hypothetical protein GCM10010168_51750 [Actinoplanes ianthinogenes]|uniref:PH domain-containing protein n=1 Tax=Actinoplanes ianthinogenes TaxID=122358 RepID=A0ABN6CMD1_9ACTN|nr:hypothetical protein [Actinoplanes ianthinogenes]BCJ46226.1 hypothetical protein Aiant_68830 [Actinoplanes ianthinogenes]GGR27182.1 hypothetical protein GCM10010168_51750 [Actinoplanes ianthinogenes]
MADSPERRKWLVALGIAALLLILLSLTLAFCDSNDKSNLAGPAASATTPTLPPVTGSAPPGTLSPKHTGASPTGNDPTADPVATSSATGHPKKPKSSPTTKRTPSGGVDAGGGSGLDGRRLSLLVTGVFLMMAALVTGRFAVGRSARD